MKKIFLTKGKFTLVDNENYQDLIQFRWLLDGQLGYFETKEAAADAYNKAAIKYHGNFASLNTI